MQMKRLSCLERDKIESEYDALIQAIEDYKDILNREERVVQIIKDDLTEIVQKYGDKRRTEISTDYVDMDDEDLIPREHVIITMTASGYIKRQPVSMYHAQNRGGKGVKCYKITEKTGNVVGVKAVSEDDEIMIINTEGIIIRMKCEGISVLGRITSGVKLINLNGGDRVASIAKVRKGDEEETESEESSETKTEKESGNESEV